MNLSTEPHADVAATIKPRWPRLEQKQLWTLLEAFFRGERHTMLSAALNLGIGACSQRVGELKRLGWQIKSPLITLPNGKRVAEYSLT